MSTKHTPGPWKWDGRWLIGSGESILWYTSDDNGIHAEEANARLIAAAPDLFEFAEEVRRTGDTRLASMAIAVIAKATGQS